MIRPLSQDNIVALATAPGIGAISVIRISGKKLIPLYKTITKSKLAPKPRYSSNKTVYDINGIPIDNTLITYFKAPKSFTGEDVIEISSHGGEYIPKKILSMLYEQNIRQAEPGEFSYRAFINGKIDLLQAEAISGIISSQTTKNATIQLKNLNGHLSDSIQVLKKNLLTLLTRIEHELDFSEEEIDFTKISEINSNLNFLYNEIKKLLSSARFGNIVKGGIRVVLCGKPNAGKSTLFNTISGSTKAIVTDVPGTTRDILESWIEIDGIPVCLVDTAGINITNNYVESIGINKANYEIENADILLILDEKSPKDFYKQYFSTKDENRIIFVNTKSDLGLNSGEGSNILNISAKNNIGIKDLLTELSTVLKNHINYNYSKDPVIVSVRQEKLLLKSLSILKNAKNIVANNFDIIILSSLLRELSDSIEELLGKITNEDIFENLFSSFCVGK